MAQAGSERSRQALQVTGRQAGTETDGEFGLIVRPCLFGACGHGASGPGLTILFFDEILVFSGSEILFRNFDKFR